MYDIHYDLLTILYCKMKRHNNFDKIEDFLIELASTYHKNNIIGGIINLYFMPLEDMELELGITEEETKDVKAMFAHSIQLLENMKTLGLIPEETDFMYGIEGATYLEIDDLNELYDLGLRSLIPVYNEKNKYGSGCLETGGLTEEGVKLIEKMIELGIIIDVSHANEETFYDILKIVEQKTTDDYTPTVIASHSNVRDLCDRKRNLTKEQLLRLKEIGGYISLFTNGNFISLNNEELTYPERREAFLKHMDYLLNEVKFDQNKILISSDDMNFHPDESYHHLETFPLNQTKQQLKTLLTEHYNLEFANQVMFKNASQLFEKVREKQKMYKI